MRFFLNVSRDDSIFSESKHNLIVQSNQTKEKLKQIEIPIS
jgi:hypothetical protein